jgi:hypothetical protein
MSQKTDILAHLQHGPITPMEALKKYGCFRLAARIDNLRQDGHDIATEMVDTGDKRWAKYSLVTNS